MSDNNPSDISVKQVTCKTCNTRQTLTQTGRSGYDPTGRKREYGTDYQLSLSCGHDPSDFVVRH